MSFLARFAFLSGLLFSETLSAATFGRIWLTHGSSDPSRLFVNWETDAPGDSMVEFGVDPQRMERVAKAESVTRHHVEIRLKQRDVVYHYRVRSGGDVSAGATFKAYPTKTLRVAIVADWGYAQTADFTAILKDDPHLLLTAGDNVPSLHEAGREGTKAFSSLIDRQPALFRSTPFLPVLGNHDRELTGRGPKPPEHRVYDVDATAFREFFMLPGDEWKWTFDIADFDLRFIALDLNHIQDFGTTWQTCHAWQEDSEQFRWYRETIAGTRAAFVFTLINEKQSQLNGLTKGAWHSEICKASALVSGFGYFAERAELADGLPYFNTCLKGDGSVYADPKSKFLAREHNYLLLTFQRGEATMTAQLKNLQGTVLDTRVIEKRKLP